MNSHTEFTSLVVRGKVFYFEAWPQEDGRGQRERRRFMELIKVIIRHAQELAYLQTAVVASADHIRDKAVRSAPDGTPTHQRSHTPIIASFQVV
jgi:hypothetical protein